MRENQKCCYNSGIGVYIRNVLNAARLLCNEDYRDPFITLGSCKCENESNPFIEIEAMHRGRTGSSNKGCAGAQIVGTQGMRRGSNSGRKRACAGIQTGDAQGLKRDTQGTCGAQTGASYRGHAGAQTGAQTGHAGAQTGSNGTRRGSNRGHAGLQAGTESELTSKNANLYDLKSLFMSVTHCYISYFIENLIKSDKTLQISYQRCVITSQRSHHFNLLSPLGKISPRGGYFLFF